MILFPNAKVNLGLNILRRRDDGFHDLESVFVPVPWHDVLEIVPLENEPAGTVKFTPTGSEIPPDGKDNLCLRAYHLLNNAVGPLPAVHLLLHKLIPTGAGLGGGSADAAFTLKGLNTLFNLGLNHDQLAQMAAKLGSDCAFFIENKPQLAQGRGEVLTPYPLILNGLWILIVHPNVHISTARAYAAIRPRVPEQRIDQLLQRPIDQWAGQIVNDFEAGAIQQHPIIGEIKSRLYATGAVYASMSGSGSAVFGLFKNEPELGQDFNGFSVKRGAL